MIYWVNLIADSALPQSCSFEFIWICFNAFALHVTACLFESIKTQTPPPKKKTQKTVLFFSSLLFFCRYHSSASKFISSYISNLYSIFCRWWGYTRSSEFTVYSDIFLVINISNVTIPCRWRASLISGQTDRKSFKVKFSKETKSENDLLHQLHRKLKYFLPSFAILGYKMIFINFIDWLSVYRQQP